MMSKEREDNMPTMEEMGLKDSAGYKNLIAVQKYAEETRSNFRVLEDKFEDLMKKYLQQQQEIVELNKKIVSLQVKLYKNNATE